MGAIKRRTVRIGTRKSRLALVQTNMVAEAIEAVCPEVKCELVPLMTKGDKILKDIPGGIRRKRSFRGGV